MTERQFKSDPLSRLGVNHEHAKHLINRIAFASPSTYFDMKDAYLKSLVEQTIVQLHGTIYYALTEGKTAVLNADGTKTEPGNWIVHPDTIGNVLRPPVGPANRIEFMPGIPPEEADKIAMDVAKSLKDEFESNVIERIFSTPQLEMAFGRSARNAELNQT